MSETELRIGKLTKVDIGEATVEETAQKILDDNEHEVGKYCESAVECLGEDFYEQYAIFKDVVYKVDENGANLEYEDIFDAIENEDGTISFTVKYYNGGCSFGEAIELALKKLKGE